MRRLDILLIYATVTLFKPQEVCGGDSIADTLSEVDARFCHGELEVIYPEITISVCSIIQRDNGLRDKITWEWGPPRVRLANAEEGKTYALMMVDPDAPSRCNATRAHWRHWLVADIAGSDLKKGDPRGLVLSEYQRPTPPRRAGLHRYQFMLFEQPADKTLSLSPEESSSFGRRSAEVNRTEQCDGASGRPELTSAPYCPPLAYSNEIAGSAEQPSRRNWNPLAFIQRFGLGSPLASVQFLTQNPKD